MRHQDFRTHVLEQRTRALASRGGLIATAEATQTALPTQLVCVAAQRYYALPIEAVASVLPFACHPIPLISGPASRAMRGLAQIGGQLVSVLDLAGLLSPAGRGGSERPTNDVMLMMRSIEPPVALGVERVLGAMALQPAPEPGHALLPGEDATMPILVSLIDETSLRRAIASIETATRFSSDPAGA